MPLTKFAFIFVITCAICGCSRRPPNQTAASMKSSLSAEIPVGTPVATAEARLRARGFSVSRQVDARWESTTQPSDYLYGDMSESGMVQRRWQVAVFHQQGVVTGIDVQAGLVGP